MINYQLNYDLLSSQTIRTRLAPHQACNRLRRWIIRCKELHEELLLSGYSPTQRFFTPRQVRLIIRYLGEPG